MSLTQSDLQDCKLYVTSHARNRMIEVLRCERMTLEEAEACIRAGTVISAEFVGALTNSRARAQSDETFVATPCGEGVAVITSRGYVPTVLRISPTVVHLLPRTLCDVECEAREHQSQTPLKPHPIRSRKMQKKIRRGRLHAFRMFLQLLQQGQKRHRKRSKKQDYQKRLRKRQLKANQPPTLKQCLRAGIARSSQSVSGELLESYAGCVLIAKGDKRWCAWGIASLTTGERSEGGCVVVADITSRKSRRRVNAALIQARYPLDRGYRYTHRPVTHPCGPLVATSIYTVRCHDGSEEICLETVELWRSLQPTRLVMSANSAIFLIAP